jgi:O-methyltransferase
MSFASGGHRPVWGFDSFAGMPELTKEDRNEGKEWVGYQCSGPEGVKEAQRTLKRFRVDGAWVKLVRGWFEDTLPKTVSQLAPIAVLRLDNDWYKSTRYCLETLYSSVAQGGLVIIDDYHTFTGCRDAVDEFRLKLGIKNPMITTEPCSEAYWRKTD